MYVNMNLFSSNYQIKDILGWVAEKVDLKYSSIQLYGPKWAIGMCVYMYIVQKEYQGYHVMVVLSLSIENTAQNQNQEGQTFKRTPTQYHKDFSEIFSNVSFLHM